MTEILQIFSGNPLSTFIGKKIEAATSPDLETDDWALNLEICDMINENDDDAKDAIRAIKKRLQQIEQDRNFLVTNRTLTVLETCVSNCSRRFHLLVMSKDFIQDLVKLIGPKNNPPIDLQERVLRLIERWADTFRNQPDLGGVVSVYNDLKAKGLTFPPKDPASEVPIQTPQRSVPRVRASPPPARMGLISVSPAGQQPPTSTQASRIVPGQQIIPVNLEGEGYNKISQDLTVVQSSIEMFTDIMKVLETNADESDWKLAADLNSTCRQMKDRIVELIEQVANEDLTIELLRLNDDLNSIFIKYDRLVKNRSKLTALDGGAKSENDTNRATLLTGASSSAGQPAFAAGSSIRPKTTENELSLIDFNADDGGQAAANQTNITDPFDSSAVDAALSRDSKPLTSSSNQPKQVDPLVGNLRQLNLGSAGDRQQQQQRQASQVTNATKGGLPEEISSVREQDFAEIENWLSTDSGRDLASISAEMPSIEPISIPNSEFENFIATRALAGSSQAPKPSSQQKRPDPAV